MTRATIATAWDAIVDTGALLAGRGLAPGTSGNLGVRVDDEVVLTPTGTELGALGPFEPALVGLDGTHRSGPPPTKEWAVHVAMLRARPDAGAVVHLHSPHAVAVSCLAGLDPDDVLPPLTAYFVMRVGRLVLVPYMPPGDPALGDAVGAAALESAALLLANHGLVAAGRDLTDARTIAEEIETTARLFLLIGDRPVSLLTTSEVAELRRRWRSG
jgi:ribulose-5-phosphate 4-epimerase/fuculose-1-phosphate aldolase